MDYADAVVAFEDAVNRAIHQAVVYNGLTADEVYKELKRIAEEM